MGDRSSPEEDPAGLVWQTQQPLITSNMAELTRWPRLLERVSPMGSELLLAAADDRPARWARGFASKEQAAYDAADVDFLQRVANQVAVALENALAFARDRGPQGEAGKGEGLPGRGDPHRENFEEIVGESAALRGSQEGGNGRSHRLHRPHSAARPARARN